MLKRNPFIYFEHTPFPLESGCVLISVPFCGGGCEYFERTVIFLIYHDEEGTYGLVLNRSIGDAKFHRLINNVKSKPQNIPLSNGGPVKIKNLYAIHTLGNLTEDTIPVSDEFYFSPLSKEVIETIFGDDTEENIIRIYFGYAGWSAGQLESELENKMWVIGQFQKELLFYTDDDDCWKTAVKSLGGEYLSWFDIVKEPELN